MWHSKSILIGREVWEWRREFWLDAAAAGISTIGTSKNLDTTWRWNYICWSFSCCVSGIKQDSALNLLVIIDNVLIYSMIYK